MYRMKLRKKEVLIFVDYNNIFYKFYIYIYTHKGTTQFVTINEIEVIHIFGRPWALRLLYQLHGHDHSILFIESYIQSTFK